MINSAEAGPSSPTSGATILGPGWKAVASFDDLSDADEYEDEEEEVYVTLDLGTAVDNKAIQTESSYQLIGMDTPTPFLKLGNQVFVGSVTPLIGDEVILGHVRSQQTPSRPTHPPLYKTSHRITFRPITLRPLHTPSPPPKQPTATPPLAAIPNASSREATLDEAGLPMRVKRTGGRPRGSASRPKKIFGTIEEIRSVDVSGLAENLRLMLSPGLLEALPAEKRPRKAEVTREELVDLQLDFLTEQSATGGGAEAVEDVDERGGEGEEGNTRHTRRAKVTKKGKGKGKGKAVNKGEHDVPDRGGDVEMGDGEGVEEEPGTPPLRAIDEL